MKAEQLPGSSRKPDRAARLHRLTSQHPSHGTKLFPGQCALCQRVSDKEVYGEVQTSKLCLCHPKQGIAGDTSDLSSKQDLLKHRRALGGRVGWSLQVKPALLFRHWCSQGL